MITARALRLAFLPCVWEERYDRRDALADASFAAWIHARGVHDVLVDGSQHV